MAAPFHYSSSSGPVLSSSPTLLPVFDKHSILLTVVVAVSLLLLLVTTFVLYVHWLCRYRHYPPHSSWLAAPPPLPPQGLHSSPILGSLPLILQVSTGCHDDVLLGSECAICLSLLQEDEEIKMLPQCHHAYHSQCVDKWLATQSTCPLCRSSPLSPQAACSSLPPA